MANKQCVVRSLAFVFVTLSCFLTVDACFPSKYWISCLIDTCKLGGKCPGDPSATCRMEKSECNGCTPTWYTPSGQKANCSVTKNLNLCPGGETVVHCKVDSCKWPCDHPDFKGAQCRQSYCGECSAEYLLKDTWVKCPVGTPGVQGEILPVDSVISDNCHNRQCPREVCGGGCSAVPGAVCRASACDNCRPKWYLDTMPVNCQTGQFLTELQSMSPIVSAPAPSPPWQRTCADGVALTTCDMRVCEQKICRNFPNAECRPDGCGGCKDTWFVDNKLVDCLSDECPPRVPIVKCVDDPCKYFGHYCPAAECRASQCGKCEAKFYANGQEIDCAMPPKQCNVGVKSRMCPWYTCPANICPSNSRLMCRINPCGNRCEYEFVDIYNGEILPCRVFDGDGNRKPHNQPELTFTDSNQIPKLGNIVPDSATTVQEPTLLGVALPQSLDIVPAVATSDRIQPLSGSVGAGGFKAEPVFINPGPPIMDADLLSILRSFPHEMINIPSASIQTALKKDTGAAAAAIQQQDIVLPPPQVSEPIGVLKAIKPEKIKNSQPNIPMQNTNIQSQNTNFPPQNTNFGQDTNFGPQNTNFGSQDTHFQPQDTHFAPHAEQFQQIIPNFQPQNTNNFQQDNPALQNTQPAFETNGNFAPFDPIFPLLNANIQAQQQQQQQIQDILNAQQNQNNMQLLQNDPFIDVVPPQQNHQLNKPTFDNNPINPDPAMQNPQFADQVSAQSMKNFFTSPDNSFGTQLLDIAKTDSMFRDMPAEAPIIPNQASPEVMFSNNNAPREPLYPELSNIPQGPIAAGKPKMFGSKVLGQKPKPKSADKVTPPKQPSNGVPISMSMFSQWASL